MRERRKLKSGNIVSKIASKKLKLFQKAEVMLGANVLSLASPSDLVVNLK